MPALSSSTPLTSIKKRKAQVRKKAMKTARVKEKAKEEEEVQSALLAIHHQILLMMVAEEAVEEVAEDVAAEDEDSSHLFPVASEDLCYRVERTSTIKPPDIPSSSTALRTYKMKMTLCLAACSSR